MTNRTVFRTTLWYFAIYVLVGLLGALVASVRGSDLTTPHRIAVEGVIIDEATNEPVPFATVRVLETGISTVANDAGRYRLLLKPGSYELRITHVAHHANTVIVSVSDSPVTQDISLTPAPVFLGDLKAYDRKYDPGQRIILEAIKRKRDILERLHDYSFEAYAKFRVDDLTPAKADDETPAAFAARSTLLLTESQITAFWEYADEYKEIITARRQSANMNPESNLLTVGEILNFNRNRIEINEYSVVSPTATDALDHYNYYLLDSIMVDGRNIYRLEIEPIDPLEPLFAGEIRIADETFDVVLVDVGVSPGMEFPMISGLRYSQRCALFNNDYWMPVEIRFAADVELQFPFPGIPARMGLDYAASLYDYSFETGHPKGTFDEYVLEVDEGADDVDTTSWYAKQTIPLSDAETKAYARIDSIEAVPDPPLQQAARALFYLPFLMLSDATYDLYHYNRVEGAYLGLGITNSFCHHRLKIRAKSGYGFETAEWQHRYEAAYIVWPSQKLSIGAGYHDEVVGRESITTPDEYNPTFLALLYRIDPYDYYLEKGWRYFMSARLVDHTRLKLQFADYNYYSSLINSEYSVFDGDGHWRANPPVAEGKLRSVSAVLSFDSRKLWRLKGEDAIQPTTQYTKAAVGVEYASPDLVSTDFDYRRYWAELYRRQRLPGMGITSLYAFAGASDRSLPPQRYFAIDDVSSAFFSTRGFNTLDERPFTGNRLLSFYIDHHFPRNLLAKSRLPLIEKLPFTLKLHGGLFWSEFADHTMQPGDELTQPAPDGYSEVGFGIGNLTPFLLPFNFEARFTWQLTAYDTSKFKFQLGFDL